MAGVAARLRSAARQLLPPVLAEGLRRVLPRRDAVADGTPADCAAQPTERKYWGLEELDRKIEKYLNYDGGFFVELGANDGRLSSNTLYYERYKGWRGVLVEPAPNLFLECRRNRSDQNHVACAACVSFDYKEEFVKILYSDSMSVSLGIESDIPDRTAHAELGRQFLRAGETVFAFGAVARTLDSILREAQAPRLIDFLSLDVEGSELEVLRGIDHDAFAFRYLLVECRHLARLQAFLTPLGYALVERFNEHDYMFESTGLGGSRGDSR
jgi:FkbM family methyltransferase